MNCSISASLYTVFKKIPFKEISLFLVKVASIAIPIISILHLYYKKKNTEQKELGKRVQDALNEQLQQSADRIAHLTAENTSLRRELPPLERQLVDSRGAAARMALEIETLKQESAARLSNIELLQKKASEDSSIARRSLEESRKEKFELRAALEATHARIVELERELHRTSHDLRVQIGRTEAAVQRALFLEERELPSSSPRRDYVAIDFLPPPSPEGAFTIDLSPLPVGEDLV